MLKKQMINVTLAACFAFGAMSSAKAIRWDELSEPEQRICTAVVTHARPLLNGQHSLDVLGDALRAMNSLGRAHFRGLAAVQAAVAAFRGDMRTLLEGFPAVEDGQQNHFSANALEVLPRVGSLLVELDAEFLPDHSPKNAFPRLGLVCDSVQKKRTAITQLMLPFREAHTEQAIRALLIENYEDQLPVRPPMPPQQQPAAGDAVAVPLAGRQMGLAVRPPVGGAYGYAPAFRPQAVPEAPRRGAYGYDAPAPHHRDRGVAQAFAPQRRQQEAVDPLADQLEQLLLAGDEGQIAAFFRDREPAPARRVVAAAPIQEDQARSREIMQTSYVRIIDRLARDEDATRLFLAAYPAVESIVQEDDAYFCALMRRGNTHEGEQRLVALSVEKAQARIIAAGGFVVTEEHQVDAGAIFTEYFPHNYGHAQAPEKEVVLRHMRLKPSLARLTREQQIEVLDELGLWDTLR